MAREQDAYTLGMELVKRSGIMAEIYQDRSPESMSRQENIEELVNGMRDFCDGRQEEGNPHVLLSDYLSEIALLTDQDEEQGESTAESDTDDHSFRQGTGVPECVCGGTGRKSVSESAVVCFLSGT